MPQHLKKMWFAGSAHTDEVNNGLLTGSLTPACIHHQALTHQGAQQEVKERFADTMAAAATGRLDWLHGFEALAAVILQDQLTRFHVYALNCSSPS